MKDESARSARVKQVRHSAANGFAVGPASYALGKFAMELAVHGAPPIYLPEPCISQRPEAACQQITGCSTTSRAQGVDDQWIATCHSSENVSEDGWVRARHKPATQTRD